MADETVTEPVNTAAPEEQATTPAPEASAATPCLLYTSDAADE